MSEDAIQRIICRAVVSERFRDQLLGVDRGEILRNSDLDPLERVAFLAIPAETIEEFAAGVERAIRSLKRGGNTNHCRERLPIHDLSSIDTPGHEG